MVHSMNIVCVGLFLLSAVSDAMPGYSDAAEPDLQCVNVTLCVGSLNKAQQCTGGRGYGLCSDPPNHLHKDNTTQNIKTVSDAMSSLRDSPLSFSAKDSAEDCDGGVLVMLEVNCARGVGKDEGVSTMDTLTQIVGIGVGILVLVFAVVVLCFVFCDKTGFPTNLTSSSLGCC